MSKESIPFTKRGFEQLQAELQRLKSEERPRVIQDIAEARSHGDLSENAEYSAARERQGFIEGRIAELEDKLSRAQVIDPSEGDQNQVRFGAFVTLCDEESGEQKTYQIVGDIEADIRENRISLSSPLARALVGKRVDDLIEVHAPKGSVEYTITSIHY
ncbi:MAG: transcription elongation factor GreA [Pseudomonadota bacterium]|jgi:transcription elongation factor GreA